MKHENLCDKYRYAVSCFVNFWMVEKEQYDTCIKPQ